MYKSPSFITVRKKGEGIKEYPVLSNSKGIPHPVVIQYGINKESLILQAAADYKKGCCILWIENTVGEAQYIYDRFSSLIDPDDVGLLHSRFTVKDRSDKESIWTHRLGKTVPLADRKPCILVSTQVCEQSLDIDADILYTSICPMDMFIQRIGRIWRHRIFDASRPAGIGPTVRWFGWVDHTIEETLEKIDHLVILDHKFKEEWKSLYIYDLFILARTIEILESNKQIHIPVDIRKLLEETYAGV